MSALHSFIQRLGLREHHENVRGFDFVHEAAIKLYKTEVALLFAILVQQALNRRDPALFDEELGVLLEHYGPQIWPTGTANRDHLLRPAEHSLYPSQLEYPKDKDILKDGLRGVVISRQIYVGMNTRALIARLRKESVLSFQGLLPRATQPSETQQDTIGASHSLDLAPGNFESESDSGSSPATESPVVGVKTRLQSRPQGAESVEIPFSVGIYLYSDIETAKISQGQTLKNPVWLELSGPWMNLHTCFSRISKVVGAKCMYMVFNFETKGQIHNVRVERGHPDAEETFNGVINMIRSAGTTVVNEYPSVELNVGYSWDF